MQQDDDFQATKKQSNQNLVIFLHSATYFAAMPFLFVLPFDYITIVLFVSVWSLGEMIGNHVNQRVAQVIGFIGAIGFTAGCSAQSSGKKEF